MLIRAYLDINGNAFVGNAENTDWLYNDLPPGCKRIYNERGGEDLSVEDIDYAFINHKPQGVGIWYDSPETKAFCENQITK